MMFIEQGLNDSSCLKILQNHHPLSYDLSAQTMATPGSNCNRWRLHGITASGNYDFYLHPEPELRGVDLWMHDYW